MGRITHFEIHADDPARAARFYETVLGWEFQEWKGTDGEPAPMEYWLVKTGPDDEHGINGGMHRRRGHVDGHGVIAYVCTAAVDDVDATAALVEKNGGALVVPKMPIQGVGWLIYAKDPEGNIFGMMEADPEAG